VDSDENLLDDETLASSVVDGEVIRKSKSVAHRQLHTGEASQQAAVLTFRTSVTAMMTTIYPFLRAATMWAASPVDPRPLMILAFVSDVT
jgi:hypothetical protein